MHFFKIFVLAGCLLCAPSLHAQLLEQVAPKNLPAPGLASAPQEPILLPTPKAAALQNPATVIVPQLQSIHLGPHKIKENINEQTRLQKTQESQTLKNIILINPALFKGEQAGSAAQQARIHAALEKALAPYLGGPLTVGMLAEIPASILKTLQARSPFVADVIIPPGQSVTGGHLHVWVLEGRLGSVSIARAENLGNNENGESATEPEPLSPRVVRWAENTVRAQPGQRIHLASLVADRATLNAGPFRRANVALLPGTSVGDVNLQVSVTQAPKLWSGYTGYEDSGSDFSGFSRLLGGLNFGDVLSTNDNLGYQFTGSKGLEQFRAHALNYTLPLKAGHRFSAYASHSRSQPNVGGLSLISKTLQIGLRYTVPGQWLLKWLPGSFTAGYDFKQANSDLALGGQTIFGTFVDVHNFQLAWAHALNTLLGRTNYSLAAHGSPGGITNSANATSYTAARAGTHPRYGRLTANITHQSTLAQGLQLRLRAQGQLASRNVLPSEQLQVGGATWLRGFDAGEASGDHGWALAAELWGPQLSLRAASTLQPYVFTDTGSVYIKDRLANQRAHTQLASAGLGFSFTYQTLRINATYGWQLRGEDIDKRTDRRAHISATYAF